ncbi:MAG: Mfa1 fimbrilin C-terminal domain-containing protein [Alistipes sp.]|nr:Mfa1 fimbrilin C-terminal domain-containing protein [Alistipes sp.]
MKKYLFIALAALGFAACTEKGEDNAPIQNAELEESYIAINLMAADVDSRAVTDDIGNADEYGYELGTEAERKINSAYFFFFDENGNPFNVNGAPATAPGGNKNHMALTISEATTSAMPNVSDIKEAVLVLKTYKGVYPSKIVAVLNWTPADRAYSLAELHDELANLGNDSDGYVMSNSVYMDGAGKVVDAVPLTAANIKTSEEEAIAAPVEIYVERIAAKVVVAGNSIYDTQKDTIPIVAVGDTSNIDVYVKLLGWELYNDYSTTNLLKNIDPTWNVTTLGLTWNDIPYYRCYWADSQDGNPNDKFSWSYTDDVFPTAYGFKVADSANYAEDTYTYCGENTTVDYRTKVILKGQLVKADSDAEGGYSTLELARWYGTEYAGNEALRIAVANSLKYTLYSSADGKSFASITQDDIECVAGATVGAQAYEVGFQLSTAGQSKTWYQYSSANGYQPLGAIDSDANKTATNSYLKSVEPALLYANGMTYYTVDIEHLGTAAAKYGVVRNHVYQIDIQSIKGYGSPVFSGDIGFLKPEFPTEDEASYVAARINVLSWKVVKQGVDIVQ